MKHPGCGVFLVIIFVPLFIITFLFYNFKTILLSPDFYKSQFEKSQVFPKVVDSISGISDIGDPEQKGAISEQDLLTIIKESLSTEWLQNTFETNIDNYFDWLYYRKDRLEVSASLTELKESLKSKTTQTLKQKYESLPVCTSTQLKSKQQDNCRPPGISFDVFQKEFLAPGSKSEFAFWEKLPDQFDLVSYLEQKRGEGVTQSLERVRKNFQNFITALYILIGILGLIILSIIILARQSFSAVLKWLGLSLIIPSFLLLIPIFISGFFLPLLIKQSLSSFMPMPEASQKALIDLINSFLGTIVSKMRLEILVVFGLAVFLLILSRLFKPKTTP